MTDREALERIVGKTRAAQGLPPTITDSSALGRIAVLLTADPKADARPAA